MAKTRDDKPAQAVPASGKIADLLLKDPNKALQVWADLCQAQATDTYVTSMSLLTAQHLRDALKVQHRYAQRSFERWWIWQTGDFDGGVPLTENQPSVPPQDMASALKESQEEAKRQAETLMAKAKEAAKVAQNLPAAPAPASEPQGQAEPDSAVPAATLEQVVASAGQGEPDDLTRIRGIGPKFARELNDLGIKRYAQIVAMTPDVVSELEDRIGFPGRVARDEWQAQARDLQG